MNTTALCIPRKELLVLELIRRRGRLSTRIKESGSGDHEYLQGPADPEPEMAISDDDLLTCLHSLEGRGLLTCRMHVHVWSTTEYICEWTLS